MQEPGTAGRALVTGLGQHLRELAFEGDIRVVRLEAKDPNAFFVANPGGFADTFRDACRAAPSWESVAHDPEPTSPPGENAKPTPTQAQILVQLFSSGELFHTPDRKAFAVLTQWHNRDS